MMRKKKSRFVLALLMTVALFASVVAAPAGASSTREEQIEERIAERVARRAARVAQKKAERATPRVPGAVYTLSDKNFDDTVDAITAALNANPAIGVPLVVNHAAAAATVGLELEPNTVIYFGNPNLGTPLMQADQVAGIDLPQKLHVIEENGRVFVGYNSVDLLRARHDVSGVASLDTIAGALANFTAIGAGADQFSVERNARRFQRNDNLTTVASDAGFEETVNRLRATLVASPANIALELDHQANAARVGLELRPTTLFVFGNPNLGTPLMQANPAAGIDLPLKMLVWEDADGQVNVTTNDTRYLTRRYRGIERADVATIDGAIGNFLNAATKTPASS